MGNARNEWRWLALALWCSACGGSVPEPEVATIEVPVPDSPVVAEDALPDAVALPVDHSVPGPRGDGPVLCAFDGTVTAAPLRANRSGRPFLRAAGRAARSSMRLSDDGPVLDVQVEAAGFRLVAHHPLVGERGLFTARALWVEPEVLALVAAAPLAVLDARPGEVRVEAPAPDLDDVRLLEPLVVWVPCDDIGFDGEPPDDPVAGLGVRRTGGRMVRLREGHQLQVARAPGAPPFVLVETEREGGELPLLVLPQRRRGFVRVEVPYAADVLLFGWVDASAVRSLPAGRLQPLRSFLGGLGPISPDGAELDRCEAQAEVPVYLDPDAAEGPERVGTILPRATFLPRGPGPEGWRRVRPAPNAGVRPALSGPGWFIPADAPVRCGPQAPPSLDLGF